MDIQPPRGTHWGHVTLLSKRRVPLMDTDNEGNAYVADSHGGPLTLFIRCDCGREFDMPAKEFPGRRNLKSCGHPECQFTKKPRKPRQYPGQKGQSITLYLERNTMNQIYPISEIWNLSTSATIGRILKSYLTEHPIGE